MPEKDRAEIYVLNALLDGDEVQATRILDCFSDADRAAFALTATRLHSLITPSDAALPAPRHSTETVVSDRSPA